MSRLSGHPVSSSPIRIDLPFLAGFGASVTAVVALFAFLLVQGFGLIFSTAPQSPPFPAAEVARAVVPEMLGLSTASLPQAETATLAPITVAARPVAPSVLEIRDQPADPQIAIMRHLDTGATPDPRDLGPTTAGIQFARFEGEEHIDIARQKLIVAPESDKWLPQPEVLVSADPFYETQQFINEVVRRVVIEAALPTQRPLPRPTDRPLVHVIAPGESLADLAQRYLGDGERYMQIYEANRDALSSPDVVKVGQQILIPRAEQFG